MWSISCNIQHFVHQQSQHKIQWLMLWKITFRHYRQANTANLQSAQCDDVIKRMKARAPWKQNGCEPWECSAASDPKRCLRLGNDEKLTSYGKNGSRNGSRIMWKERRLWQGSELKIQRQQLNRCRMIWEMLNRRDWQPPSLKQHLRRCWMPSVIVWASLQVPTMRRMGKTRMMRKKILWGASLAKMTNPAGWWAQSPKRYSIACSVFGRSRSRLMNWRNLAGETRPTTYVRGIRSTGRPNGRFQLSFNLKRCIMRRHQRQRDLVSIWRYLIESPGDCECRKWHLDRRVVISG